jgi:hypothetical protein
MDVDAKRAHVEAKKMNAEAKIWEEDTTIMLTDLSTMHDKTRALFPKKRAKPQKSACVAPDLPRPCQEAPWPPCELYLLIMTMLFPFLTIFYVVPCA